MRQKKILKMYISCLYGDTYNASSDYIITYILSFVMSYFDEFYLLRNKISFGSICGSAVEFVLLVPYSHIIKNYFRNLPIRFSNIFKS